MKSLHCKAVRFLDKDIKIYMDIKKKDRKGGAKKEVGTKAKSHRVSESERQPYRELRNRVIRWRERDGTRLSCSR